MLLFKECFCISVLYLLFIGSAERQTSDDSTIHLSSCLGSDVVLFKELEKDFQTLKFRKKGRNSELKLIGYIAHNETNTYAKRFHIFDNGILKIVNLRLMDEGRYQRERKNGGTFISNITLTVLEAPNASPTFTHERNGAYIRLTCTPPRKLGYPPARIYIKDSNNNVLRDLNITTNGGNYSCCIFGTNINCLASQIKTCVRFETSFTKNSTETNHSGPDCFISPVVVALVFLCGAGTLIFIIVYEFCGKARGVIKDCLKVNWLRKKVLSKLSSNGTEPENTQTTSLTIESN